MGPTTTIDAQGGRVHSVVTWEHYVAWTAAGDADSDPDRVYVHDLDTQKTTVVATTSFRGGTVPRIRAGKDSLVFLDMARLATPDDSGTEWRMYEVSVSTGRARQLLASATPEDRAEPPIPSVSWPWVAWLGRSGSSVQALDLRDGRRRVVVEPAAASQLSIDDATATVHYDDDNGAGGRDVFSAPLEGAGAPTKVSASGQADFPIARNGGVVWQEPPGGQSSSLWYRATTPDSRPHRFSTPEIANAPHAGNNAFPGRGFVVWLAGPRLVVTDPAAEASPLALQERDVSIPGRWWVEGDRVAWASLSGVGTAAERSAVHVATITRP